MFFEDKSWTVPLWGRHKLHTDEFVRLNHLRSALSDGMRLEEEEADPEDRTSRRPKKLLRESPKILELLGELFRTPRLEPPLQPRDENSAGRAWIELEGNGSVAEEKEEGDPATRGFLSWDADPQAVQAAAEAATEVEQKETFVLFDQINLPEQVEARRAMAKRTTRAIAALSESLQKRLDAVTSAAEKAGAHEAAMQEHARTAANCPMKSAT